LPTTHPELDVSSICQSEWVREIQRNILVNTSSSRSCRNNSDSSLRSEACDISQSLSPVTIMTSLPASLNAPAAAHYAFLSAPERAIMKHTERSAVVKRYAIAEESSSTIHRRMSAINPKRLIIARYPTRCSGVVCSFAQCLSFADLTCRHIATLEAWSLIGIALTTGFVQLFDTLIGFVKHDLSKTYGPLVFAVATGSFDTPATACA
jgi:hypothetical protein